MSLEKWERPSMYILGLHIDHQMCRHAASHPWFRLFGTIQTNLLRSALCLTAKQVNKYTDLETSRELSWTCSPSLVQKTVHLSKTLHSGPSVQKSPWGTSQNAVVSEKRGWKKTGPGVSSTWLVNGPIIRNKTHGLCLSPSCVCLCVSHAKIWLQAKVSVRHSTAEVINQTHPKEKSPKGPAGQLNPI